MNTVGFQGLGQKSRHTMIPLMEFQLGNNRRYPLFWQVLIMLDLHNLGTHLFWDVKKVIDFLVTLSSPHELSLKDLTLKLSILLALTSETRASAIGFLNI